MEIKLSEKETINLYTYLKSSELTINSVLLGILQKIEKKIYSRLTIEQIEQLEIQNTKKS
ncbi:MAG: hypothetical protein GXP33_13550 [Spirochaetes bacterium]|nr:hypothetical protein [Spirochaetota bacterium]